MSDDDLRRALEQIADPELVDAPGGFYCPWCGTNVNKHGTTCPAFIARAALAARPEPLTDADGDPVPPDSHSEDWYDGYASGQRDGRPEPRAEGLRGTLASELLDAVQDLLAKEPTSYWLRHSQVSRLRSAYDAVIEEANAATPPAPAPLDVERLATALMNDDDHRIANPGGRTWFKAAESIAREYAARAPEQPE